ncbi:PQQ-dependent dehydrogenase, methanol/ethanol family [Sphingomonas sp. MMS24-J13]|uniref:PQQ-dependent dehydrogenase, methanol/ethanol family n=1 Tax=Sphingomonas sp. MMS24-J13 TaxID=3238686 RepID=UPI00384E4573
MRLLATSGAAIVLAGIAVSATAPQHKPVAHGAGWVDQDRLTNASSDLDNWLGYGRTWREERYSPLEQINDKTVGKLRLAWTSDFDTIRGQEATPIVVDGVMYTSTAWSKVIAMDAATGRVLWKFDPHNEGSKAVHACCDVVNRGVAVWKGKVFVGTIDGRLIALDAATGKQVWSVLTIDQSKPYTITGAPRVFKDKVIIGNSGAELGVRGFVTAYDTATGKLVWRFYTVPGDPAKGPDGAASDEPLAKLALPTWHGKWWELGGGGTVWDSMVYDQELDQLLIGVGNGSPWNHRARSAGKGDNLFLSSIVAVDPDTGKYKWHYQETPAESWDFTATQQMILATLDLGSGPRKVVMQAPKNGFFFVIDRTNGKMLSAKQYVPVNWATGYDMTTGRPIERPEARYADKPAIVYPSGIGAHAWMPMSYNPKTGLVYIPAMEVPITYGDDTNAEVHPGRWNTKVAFAPTDPAAAKEVEGTPRGELVAWDPVAQKEVWRHQYDYPWNGGTLTTGGNLVFQGDAHGFFHAYAADTGRSLWSFQARRGVLAGPITYRVNGVQYVAVLAGYGGSMGVASTNSFMHYPQPTGRVLVFRLDGTAKAPTDMPAPKAPLVDVKDSFTDKQRAEGGKWFATYCTICHGGPVNPDLTRSQVPLNKEAWRSVVIDGALSGNGMASFSQQLTPEQAETIRAYIADQAHQLSKQGR